MPAPVSHRAAAEVEAAYAGTGLPGLELLRVMHLRPCVGALRQALNSFVMMNQSFSSVLFMVLMLEFSCCSAVSLNGGIMDVVVLSESRTGDVLRRESVFSLVRPGFVALASLYLVEYLPRFACC